MHIQVPHRPLSAGVLGGADRVQQVSHGQAVMVLERYGTDVAQVQAQPGQLVLRRGHLAVANEDNVCQRQEARQASLLTEGRQLWRVGRTVAGATRQHVKPHR
jgi:hypothetical protein